MRCGHRDKVGRRSGRGRASRRDGSGRRHPGRAEHEHAPPHAAPRGGPAPPLTLTRTSDPSIDTVHACGKSAPVRPAASRVARHSRFPCLWSSPPSVVWTHPRPPPTPTPPLAPPPRPPPPPRQCLPVRPSFLTRPSCPFLLTAYLLPLAFCPLPLAPVTLGSRAAAKGRPFPSDVRSRPFAAALSAGRACPSVSSSKIIPDPHLLRTRHFRPSASQIILARHRMPHRTGHGGRSETSDGEG